MQYYSSTIFSGELLLAWLQLFTGLAAPEYYLPLAHSLLGFVVFMAFYKPHNLHGFQFTWSLNFLVFLVSVASIVFMISKSLVFMVSNSVDSLFPEKFLTGQGISAQQY